MEYPSRYLEFIEHFNRGLFWESHEVLEEAWRRNRSPFYQGLIIAASVLVHAQRGNPRGVLKQAVKCERYLTPYTPAYMGLDVAELLAHIERCCNAAQRYNPATDGRSELFGQMPPYALVLHDHLVRGDEPEFCEGKL